MQGIMDKYLYDSDYKYKLVGWYVSAKLAGVVVPTGQYAGFRLNLKWRYPILQSDYITLNQKL